MPIKFGGTVKSILARKIKSLFYSLFYSCPRPYKILYNNSTGPYRIWMRLADGQGMVRRLRVGTEIRERSTFLQFIKKGQICCDVGAEVGSYTIEMALSVGPKGKVYSFEASSHYHDLLKRSISINKLDNVILKHAVVGAASGKIKVFSDMIAGNLSKPVRIGKSFLNFSRKAKTEEVPAVCLDNELDWLDAVKIDCEGYEFFVLKGMRKLIQANRNIIILVEVHNDYLPSFGVSLSSLAELILEEYAFNVYCITPRHFICSFNKLSMDGFNKITSVNEFINQC